MPSRGERSAPTFDQTQPREIVRFFDELERLFVRVGVTDQQEMKKDACRYVDFSVERVWKTFPEYGNNAKTFLDFKQAILVHYPDAEGDYVYSVNDLDKHINDTIIKGITTTDALQTFHLEFLTISTWLIQKELMGLIEQRRAYLRVFTGELLTRIKARLSIKFMDQHPSKPHTVNEVYETARFVLQDGSVIPQTGYVATIQPVATPSSSSPFVPTADNMPVKAETFASVMAGFSKTIADAMIQSNRQRYTGPSASPTSNRHTDCNFCGGAHFIRECPVVDEYIVAGKVRRNIEGKVVLSTGAFLPRDIPGTLMSERVNTWHERNPNQLAAATLVHTISTEHVRSHAQPKPVAAFQLSADERIAVLEAELFALKSRTAAFTPVVRTRAQRAREAPFAASIEEVEDEDANPAPARVPVAVPARTATPETTPIPSNPQAVVPHKPVVTVVSSPVIDPEHPYRNAKDGAYAPLASRNVGGIIKLPPTKAGNTTGPAYKTLPPVHDPVVAAEVYQRAMDAPVTITHRELLSLSPEVRAQVREITTTKRIPTGPQPAAQAHLNVVSEEDLPYDIAPAFSLNKHSERILPEGALAIGDPIEAYYESLGPGEEPDLDRLTVAKESTAIRSIHALIDTSQKKECTVDPGCQVVAMSEATCHSLGLSYDPKIRLNMESANGTFDWSLGLARNIPFLIGTITLYLQVHVIRSPSYQILLGRPFDVLTESVIRNYTNEDQTITITDPNTGAQCTVPTFARGSRRDLKSGRQTDF